MYNYVYSSINIRGGFKYGKLGGTIIRSFYGIKEYESSFFRRREKHY